jgi:hypothetical protein
MSVVRDFCGHGLGRLFHDEPNIVHIGRPGEGIVLKPGMFFTVEPMINLGRPHVKVLSDGWTAVTRDRSLSAQFEHSVGVTDKGVEVFTAIEPVIGHMKAEGHLGRCYLKGTAGDAANAILTAVGYNFRRILAWLRILLCLILAALRSALATDPELKLAS